MRCIGIIFKNEITDHRHHKYSFGGGGPRKCQLISQEVVGEKARRHSAGGALVNSRVLLNKHLVDQNNSLQLPARDRLLNLQSPEDSHMRMLGMISRRQCSTNISYISSHSKVTAQSTKFLTVRATSENLRPSSKWMSFISLWKVVAGKEASACLACCRFGPKSSRTDKIDTELGTVG